jgi:hypothetical protein
VDDGRTQSLARRTAGGGLLLAVLLSGIGVLWWRFNAQPPLRGTQFPADLIQYFFPLTQQAAARLASGEMPLWNPYACSGIPLLATMQVAVFYPGTWLSVWLSPERGLPLVMLIECLASGVCGAWLFRAWGLSGFAAAVGGILYVFACVLGQTFWPPEVATLTWLPWILLCIEKLLRRRRWRWWFGLSFGTALQVLAGFPQFVAYTFYIAAPYALLRLVETHLIGRRDWSAAARSGVWLAVAIGLGFGMTGAQVLPTIELIGETHQSRGLGRDEVHYLSGASDMRTVLANAVDPKPKLISFDFGKGGGYLGTPALISLAVGLIAGRRRRLVWLLAPLAALALMLSDGYRGPIPGLYELYTTLPAGSTFRAPERLRLLFLFGAISISAIGLDRLVRGPEHSARWTWRLALAVAVATTCLVCVSGSASAAGRAGLTLALIAVMLWGSARPPIRWLSQAALLVLIVVDLALATAPSASLRTFPSGWTRVYHTGGHTIVDAADFADLREDAGLQRLALNGGPGGIPSVLPVMGSHPVDGAYRFSCYERLVPRAWSDAFKMVGGRHFATMVDVDPARFPTLFDVASVKLILTLERSGHRSNRRSPGLGRIFVENSAPLPDPPDGIRKTVVVNDDALPRAYLVRHFEVRNDDEARRLVASGDFDFQRGVILDRPPEIARSKSESATVRPATVTAYAPERVEIEVLSPQDAILVRTDTHYPGWRARIDERETKIYRANGLYRAIEVPAGSHRVVFEYAPASLRRGALLSAASFLGVFAIPVARLTTRRLRARHSPSSDGS